METPNTEAGKLTEAIMADVSRSLPNLMSRDYNRIYEAILRHLSHKFQPITKAEDLPPKFELEPRRDIYGNLR